MPEMSVPHPLSKTVESKRYLSRLDVLQQEQLFLTRQGGNRTDFIGCCAFNHLDDATRLKSPTYKPYGFHPDHEKK